MAVSRHDRPPLLARRLAHLELTEWHDHAEHQLIYPSSGILSVETAAGTWIVPPRRAVWMPAECPHTHRAHGVTQVRSVLFSRTVTSWCGRGAEERDGRTTQAVQVDTARLVIDPLELSEPAVVAVSPLLREVLLALTAPASPTGARAAHLRQVALDELAFDRQPPLYLPTPADDRLRAIATMLHAEPSDARTLAEFGRAVGASERTLSRLCHAELGMSFPAWRGQVRLVHAIVALTRGQSVTAVAHRYGYSSPSAFVAAFRRVFDSTPGVYQASLRESG